MTTPGPVLQTARLTLRPVEIGDFDDLHGLTLSPASRRFFTGEPSREDSHKRLMHNIACWHVFGYGSFAMVEREGGTFAGICGLFNLVRDLNPPFAGEPEAGWVVAEALWGQGFATEGMVGALAWFDAAHAHPRTVCMITPGNTASERVAARLGYVAYREATYRESETLTCYARVRGANLT